MRFADWMLRRLAVQWACSDLGFGHEDRLVDDPKNSLRGCKSLLRMPSLITTFRGRLAWPGLTYGCCDSWDKKTPLPSWCRPSLLRTAVIHPSIAEMRKDTRQGCSVAPGGAVALGEWLEAQPGLQDFTELSRVLNVGAAENASHSTAL